MLCKITRILYVLTGFLMLVSCNEYQKVLKNEDTKPKYDLAEKFYNEGDYKRANRLFEQIAPKFVGKPQGERVQFFLADTYFRIKDYNFAGYQFERFVKSYPKSEKAAEASFLGAKSYYLLSPRYSLDQTDTDKALVKLQGFINSYPDSEYLPEANTMARELTTKKEKKAFEIAKQFTKLGKSYFLDYNVSAIAALDNFISDNPGSVFREDAYYYKIQATSVLAFNSTEDKKQERLEDAKAAYETLIRYYPETKYLKEAQEFAERIEEELKPYTKQDNATK
ncbi:outer membrane protein assembly factor BamD [Lentiprolixibacter aurantiacus]|uniref:Outer membrane protein assembly factor BamD n=1 Tax=Lentiprolixibacter aurantiacus TaxID=2993939 RepID=A0AAE3MLI1_9FLAO|nr:outer membrane protein assembly factor BamD [Lentiprolixibacter aurantiacus]MCX2719378.1 outer membrane protein assembly factor BamD [Lentiprolixibacter aurantiacus]